VRRKWGLRSRICGLGRRGACGDDACGPPHTDRTMVLEEDGTISAGGDPDIFLVMRGLLVFGAHVNWAHCARGEVEVWWQQQAVVGCDGVVEGSRRGKWVKPS